MSHFSFFLCVDFIPYKVETCVRDSMDRKSKKSPKKSKSKHRQRKHPENANKLNLLPVKPPTPPLLQRPPPKPMRSSKEQELKGKAVAMQSPTGNNASPAKSSRPAHTTSECQTPSKRRTNEQETPD